MDSESLVPGFVSVNFDIPFPTSIPNGSYITTDLEDGFAYVILTLREGTRAFFRNLPIKGPNSFSELKAKQAEPPRPHESRSYLAVNVLTDGTQKATLNVDSGADGGYAECKYYSEVTVTFFSKDVTFKRGTDPTFERTCEILNSLLDKYRVLTDDYRVSKISHERNFYFASCHSSPLAQEELSLSKEELFRTLERGRNFLMQLGEGAANVLRTNSFELLGPRAVMSSEDVNTFAFLIKESYEIPLSYELLLDALSNLQRFRDYKLAIIHAETAVEVHNRTLLSRIMAHYGIDPIQSESMMEKNSYWGVQNKFRRLDEWNERYCNDRGEAFVPFVDTTLYNKWKSDLYDRRNKVVHQGARAFTYEETSSAVGIARECIAMLESRVVGLQQRIGLQTSMKHFRLNSGEVGF
jgi:hypothetical protein